jgi:hypothetical protein
MPEAAEVIAGELDDEAVAAAFADDNIEIEPLKPRVAAAVPRKPVAQPAMPEVAAPEYEEGEEEDTEGFAQPGGKKQDKKKKKDRNQRRQLVYDEDIGQVVAKRRRKGSRKRGEWDNDEE